MSVNILRFGTGFTQSHINWNIFRIEMYWSLPIIFKTMWQLCWDMYRMCGDISLGMVYNKTNFPSNLNFDGKKARLKWIIEERLTLGRRYFQTDFLESLYKFDWSVYPIFHLTSVQSKGLALKTQQAITRIGHDHVHGRIYHITRPDDTHG